uniref:Uncharacterized protein n=1 Tax=Oryza barthii TaxID=65489 RepID=A0A0D3H958_9ORYZ
MGNGGKGSQTMGPGEFDDLQKMMVVQQSNFVMHWGRSECGSGRKGFWMVMADNSKWCCDPRRRKWCGDG